MLHKKCILILAVFSFVALKGEATDRKFVDETFCCEDEIPLLILVHSAPSNVDKRNALRSTWTRNDLHFKTVFVIGRSQD